MPLFRTFDMYYFKYDVKSIGLDLTPYDLTYWYIFCLKRNVKKLSTIFTKYKAISYDSLSEWFGSEIPSCVPDHM